MAAILGLGVLSMAAKIAVDGPRDQLRRDRTLHRVVLVEMAFNYDNVCILQQGGRSGIHAYLQNKYVQFCGHIKT